MEDFLYKVKAKGYRVFGIFDEIHVMQSEDSEMSKRLKAVRNQFTCVIGLTGTPVLNAMEGLWRIVDFVHPGYLGTIESFRYQYMQFKPRTVSMAGGRRRTIQEVVGYKDLAGLRKKLEGIIITRRKKYNLNFEYKTCRLTEYERSVYEIAAKGMLDEEKVDEKHIPARLHDLQRIADGSCTELNTDTLYSKMALLVDTLRQIKSRNEGVIIYTEYEDTYTYIGETIKKYRGHIGYKNLYYITGKTPYKTRVEVEKTLKAGDIAVITKAGCFAKGTKVIMSNGLLKNVEEIKSGEVVMGRNSSPRKVLNTVSGVDTMYKIKQSNADDYIVNSRHILTLVYANSRREFGYKKGDIVNISVEDFLSKSANFRSHFRGFKEGYNKESKGLPIEPYYLGLWLGDGSKNHAGLCVSEKEEILAEQWISYGKRLGLDCRKQKGNAVGGCTNWYFLTSHINGKVNRFTSSLRDMGILGNKRIPEIYFESSRKQRLELFSGLINTDGWAHRESLGISSTIKELAYDYKRLGDSLGYKTRISLYKTKGFGIESEVYNVSFVGYFTDVPMLMSHKTPTIRKDFKTYNWSKIDIEEVGLGNYYGFEIEGEDKLFHLEDGTVVHNCKSINLQAVNNIIVYDVPFAIGDLIQLIGRITRMDSLYDTQNLIFMEALETIDTYKRLLVQSNATLIQELFGEDSNLPFYGDIDNDVMKKYRTFFKRKLLWCK